MRTNSANYGREPRVQCEPESANFFAIKRGFCIRNVEITFITIQNAERNRLHVHVTKIPQNYTRVRCGGNYYLHYTGPTYMPNQRINTAQKETHSKILHSPTYMEITKTV